MPAPPLESEPAMTRSARAGVTPRLPRCALAISRTTARTSFSSSPSAMTRMTGSVPDLRTRMRPAPLRRASPASMHGFTRASSSGEPFLKRTFSSTCGSGSIEMRRLADAGLPSCASTASTCSAAISPSPVVEKSDRMIWPDCSPPTLKPPFFISSST